MTLSPKPQGCLLARAGSMIRVPETGRPFGPSQVDTVALVSVRVLQETEPTDNLAWKLVSDFQSLPGRVNVKGKS